MEHNPNFLKQKYDLHATPEVDKAAKRTQTRTGEKVPQDPKARIQNYLDRLTNIFNPSPLESRPNFDRRDRNVQMLKKFTQDRFVTKLDEVPDEYIEKQARERGAGGDYEQASPEQKQQFKKDTLEPVLRDQWASLEQWVDYFTSSDSLYIPDYLKYWVFREIIGLQEYDKEKKKYPKRSIGRVNKFPDLNYEGLGYVIDAVIKKYKGEQVEFEYDIQPDEKQKFSEYLKTENFAKLYAWSNELINPIPEHLLLITDGEWKKYDQGGEHRVLVDSIRGRGTGWCTAGENTAHTQLAHGDFYVFYSLDDNKKPTIPRIAIRMEGDKIAEIRGIGYKQNLDPYIGDSGVLDRKLNESNKFPDKDEYLKKEHDMKLLTEIDKKFDRKTNKWTQILTKDELIFLYEIDGKIQGFGYKPDPRVQELLKLRNPNDDAPIVFDCAPDQIAHNPNEITADTKVYIGPLVPNIFKTISHLDHIYTKFPEGRIRQESVEIDKNKTPAQYLAEFKKLGIKISDYAKYILEHMGGVSDKVKQESILAMIKTGIFGAESKQTTEQVDMVRLTVADLGFSNGATKDQIYAQAEKLGLELCPAEVGPQYRLQYTNQPMNEWVYVGMEPILDPGGHPGVFYVDRGADGVDLFGRWADPGFHWDSGDQVLFRLRK